MAVRAGNAGPAFLVQVAHLPAFSTLLGAGLLGGGLLPVTGDRSNLVLATLQGVGGCHDMREGFHLR